jgi:hypothetical protein
MICKEKIFINADLSQITEGCQDLERNDLE